MPLGRKQPQDNVDKWIAERVDGMSFVDIGGIGEWCTNERMTWAQLNGASRSAVADIAAPESKLWTVYHREMAAHGLTGIEEYPDTDVNDRASLERIGAFDFVNCTGIFYHCPNPVHVMMNLARVTGKYLITNTVVIPDVIENSVGRVEFPKASAAFMPGLSGHEREVLREHYKGLNLFVDRFAPPLESQAEAALPFVRGGDATWLPYWFLFTQTAFEALVNLSGMKVLEREVWRNHTLKFLLEKV